MLQKKLNEASVTDNEYLKNGAIKYYNQSDLLNIGQAFFDQKTGASIAVSSININREAFGVIHLPNKKSIPFKKIKPGHQWNYKYNGQKFSLIIMELNYVGGKYRVSLNEE